MYYLYKQPRIRAASAYTDDVKQFTPKIFRINIPGEKLTVKDYLVRLNLFLTSRGKMKIFYTVTDGEVSHTSYVMPKCSKFNFFTDFDYVIGPCVTNGKFRRRGLYHKVLNHIVSFIGNEETVFYMIVKCDNIPSVQGIEKAGFQKCGTVDKTMFLKRYIKTGEI